MLRIMLDLYNSDPCNLEDQDVTRNKSVLKDVGLACYLFLGDASQRHKERTNAKNSSICDY